MRIIKNRRQAAGYKLRIYIDAIKDAEKMSDIEWVDRWIASGARDSKFLPRLAWIAILEKWALAEASQFAIEEAA